MKSKQPSKTLPQNKKPTKPRKKKSPTGPKYELKDPRIQVKSEICTCRGHKLMFQSFCSKCVMELPRNMIFTLGDTWDDGFEEYYLRARNWLIDNSPRYKSESLYESTDPIGSSSGIPK